MIDSLPGDVGNVQQTVNAAEVNERTVIGNVLDNAFQNGTFLQGVNEFGTRFGAGFFQNDAAGNNDVASDLVHLQNLERLRNAHQRRNIADRTNINLRAGQEGNGAVEVNGKAAFDAAEDNAVDSFAGVKAFFQILPNFFAACFFAR